MSERRSRLRWAAGPLKPTQQPYYLQRPNGRYERAPGWYVQLPDMDFPIYIGANHVDAEIELKQMVDAQKAAAPA